MEKELLPHIKPGEELPFFGAKKKTAKDWRRDVKKADKKWAETHKRP